MPWKNTLAYSQRYKLHRVKFCSIRLRTKRNMKVDKNTFEMFATKDLWAGTTSTYCIVTPILKAWVRLPFEIKRTGQDRTGQNRTGQNGMRNGINRRDWFSKSQWFPFMNGKQKWLISSLTIMNGIYCSLLVITIPTL